MQSKPGFLLLPCFFLSLFAFLFLYMSWRTLYMQSELLALHDRLDELESAASSLGLWAVALARQEFLYFQKEKMFSCDIHQWPPGYKKFYAKLFIKSIEKNTLEVKGIVANKDMQKEVRYKVSCDMIGKFIYQLIS